MNTDHISEINARLQQMQAKSFLMIGVSIAEHSLDKIKCERKLGVDPYPNGNPNPEHFQIAFIKSDEFFKVNEETFDCIFVDGDHSAAQCFRDVKNAKRFLNPNGLIIIHDIWPTQPHHVLDAPAHEGAEWMGGVYKVWHALDMANDGKLDLVKEFYGLGFLRNDSKIPRSLGESKELTLDEYIKYRS
jgi:hypothetical protein